MSAKRALAARPALMILAAGLCALGLCACGNTLQDRPAPHNTLESMVLAPYPAYWLGLTFAGLQITEVSRDPGGAFTVQYGDCLIGGQSTCVPPLKVITSPDNGFVPGEASPRTAVALRGVRAYVAEGGNAISVPTGGVVVDVFTSAPALARAAARAAVPINAIGAPGGRLSRPAPNTGYGERPLPSQIPNPLRALH
jgi:hypothetical protein